MLAVGGSSLDLVYLNTAPSLTPGVSVIPGASNVEGSWTEIASAANISSDVYGIYLVIHGGQTSGQDKSHLLDIGVDPGGGTSYVEVIANLVCGASAPVDNATAFSGRQFYFPLFIKAGSSVAARVQGSNATAGTVIVLAYFYGNPSKPEFVKTGQYCETIGTITNSGGVSFTPGGSGAEGAWTLLGATVKDLWWFQLGVQCSTGSFNLRTTHVDLASGDATNKHSIITDMIFRSTAAEMAANMLVMDAFKAVPAGTNLYVRGSDSGAPNTGFNAVAIGIGG